MNNLINTAIAIIYSSGLLFGAGYGIKQLHDEIKRAALVKASKGLRPSEELANKLSGQKTDF